MWIDLSQPDEIIPAFGNKIILKVSRISLGSNDASSSVASVLPAPVTASSAASSGSGASQQRPTSQQQQQNSSVRAPATSSAAATASNSIESHTKHDSNDLLGVFGASSAPSPASISRASESVGDIFSSPLPSSTSSTSKQQSIGGGGGGGSGGFDVFGNSIGGSSSVGNGFGVGQTGMTRGSASSIASSIPKGQPIVPQGKGLPIGGGSATVSAAGKGSTTGKGGLGDLDIFNM